VAGPTKVWIAHSPDDPISSVCHAFEQDLTDDAFVLNEWGHFKSTSGLDGVPITEAIFAADVVIALLTPDTDEEEVISQLRQARLYRKPLLVLFWWAKGERQPEALPMSQELRILLSGWPHVYVRTSGIAEKIRRLLAGLTAEEVAAPAVAHPSYSVFVSKRSLDQKPARAVYEFLRENGRSAFLSEDSLLEQGSTDYAAEIDRAMDAATHLVVVGTSVDNIQSSWVEAEWRMFINEKRSGRKTGNLVIMLSPHVPAADLPIALRQFEVIPLEPTSYPRLLNYV